MSGLRWRLGTAIAIVAIFGYLTLSNFIPEQTRIDSPLLPDDGLRLGLDLQGGMHWLLQVRLDEAEHQELKFLKANLESVAEEEDEGFAMDDARVEGEQLMVDVPTEAAAERLREWISDTGSTEVSSDGRHFVIALGKARRERVRTDGMNQVLEVLRKRIAHPVTGIPDSIVTRQGESRILVQIPGGQIDRARGRELLEVTGFLEFKIVRDSDKNEELLRAHFPNQELPPDTVIAFERDPETNRILTAYLVDAEPAITGDYLQDARVSFDRTGSPIVAFTFNREGGRIFTELTGSNIGERLAIILDDHVYSAPNIRSRIGARGQIEGRFTTEEAADLAVVLRAGSLPIPVEIVEDHTVGPALGADSIRRGVQASVLGLVLIVLFSMVYYRLSGLYASIALVANLLLLLGVMSMFRATLTLPGIAGIVLTVGMAVDANVIIFERIREELRAGKTPRAAVATGFNRAFWTIMDANITTLITAVVLYEFGSGPIQGFAVTLAIGIVTSVFAALVLTRLMFAVYPGNRHIESLSI